MIETEEVISKKPKYDWKNLIQAWVKSNFSISAFCREHRLPQATFHYWRNRLASNTKSKYKKEKVLQPSFVPVQLAEDENSIKSNGILLQFPNGCSIRFENEFNPKLLRLISEAMGFKLC